MAWFTGYAETRYVGSRATVDFEVPDEELEGLEGLEHDNVVQEYFDDFVGDLIDTGWFRRDGDAP